MSALRWSRVALVLAVAVTMTLTSLVVVGNAHPPSGVAPSPASSLAPAAAAPAPAGPAPAQSAAAALSERVHSELAASGIAPRDIFPPDFNAPVSYAGDRVTPLYGEAPAPMGVGDFGVQEVNGKDVGRVSYTSSVEGVLQLDQLNDTYLDANGPDEVSIQLNTVLTNVDLFGNTSNQFWIQNVPVYIPSLHQLSIVDNVWNFSSPAFDFTQNSIYSADGYIYAPVYYFANGPTWHTATPFTIDVYNNATLFHNRPAVYLNYSVTLSNGRTYSGSYDRVVFNSTTARRQVTPAAMPTFQINGKQVGANGFLPNDAELTLGGSDDGDTADITNIQATMQLLTLPNGTTSYRSVPAAYDFGTDTGETAEGMAEWASNGTVPTVHIGTGPSFLIPLWGLNGSAFGYVEQKLTVSPSNAFVFATRGSFFDAGRASWAPVPVSGDAVYRLSAATGTYSYKVLLSDYRPVFLTLTGFTHRTLSLASDPSLGVYTPLWAWDDAQLAAISQPGGSGTRANPYVLDNGPGTIDPLFGVFNDYLYPVFSGIQLTFTSEYVTVTNAPSFLVQYSLPGQLAALATYGLPTFNYLQLEFQNTSHVSIVANPIISGWFFGEDGLSMGSLLLWNSSHDLVAWNDFEDMGVSVFLAGGSDNVFFGNTFTVAVPPCADPYALLNYSDQAGIEMFGNGNLVYNNAFEVPLPAVTPTYAFATYLPVVYHDTWNVTREPASAVKTFNGWRLTGSILGLGFQGGNYWSNYGTPGNPYGRTPYTDSHQITTGGDFIPLLPFYIHKVIFTETGLPAGTKWSVTILGYTDSSRSTNLTIWEPAGVYAYSVGGGSGFTPSPSTGAVTVTNTAVFVPITWT